MGDAEDRQEAEAPPEAIFLGGVACDGCSTGQRCAKDQTDHPSTKVGLGGGRYAEKSGMYVGMYVWLECVCVCREWRWLRGKTD